MPDRRSCGCLTTRLLQAKIDFKNCVNANNMNTASNNKGIANRVRQSIRAEAAYAVPPVSDAIKLDANESPWPLTPTLQAKWLECLSDIQLNRYPDGPATALTDTVRRVWQVPNEYDIMIGNGSDELIQIVEIGLAGPGGTVMTPVPTFVVYQRTADLIGATHHGIALDENFQIDLNGFIKAIDDVNPDCIFLATPNNPTGNCFVSDDVDAIASHADGLVVVDEAYGMFAQTLSLERLKRHDNVVIMRTLSKIGFAGLRVGVLIGRREWISELHKVRPPYNINALSQASAVFALENETELEQLVAETVQQRKRLQVALGEIAGMQVFPSDANFILMRCTGPHDAGDVHRHLKNAGIAVKNFDAPSTPLAGCLRISVGTSEQNDRLIASLKSL